MVVGEFTQETDLVVIGGGPAGYTAAFRAAELGVQTVLVDSRPDAALGGVCLHEGCIPSKTLLHVAQTAQLAEQAAEFGVKFGMPKIDIAAVKAWRDKTVAKLAAGLAALCKKHGVERIEGKAHFESSRTVALLDGAVPRIKFRRALIATGSQPKVRIEAPFDGACVVPPGEALRLERAPKRLLVWGGDYQAVEAAEIFAFLGSEVTLAHEGDRLLPEADADLIRPLLKRLTPRLKGVVPQFAPTGIETKKSTVKVRGEETIREFDLVIVSAGHIGNTRGLQLEKTGVKIDADGFIQVDDKMRTDDPRLFAAGDVTGGPLLADKAIAQGRVAAEAIAGGGGREHAAFDARAIPACIFTDPQIAWAGLTEEGAASRSIPHKAAKIPWGASGRAVGMGREGLTKVIYDPASRLILGVGMCGPQACEMIGEAALAIEMGALIDDLAMTLHPHPTMSEMLAEAAKQAGE